VSVCYFQNHLHEPQLCPYCNERKRRFKKLDKGLFPTCGHEECQKAGMSKGAKAERDWDKIQAKMKATYKARTGYDHNMRNPEMIQQYRDNGGFGVETEKAKENRKKTIEERYNGDVRAMLEQGAIKKYGSLSNMAKVIGKERGMSKTASSKRQFLDEVSALGFKVLSYEDPLVNKSSQSSRVELECPVCGERFTQNRFAIHDKIKNGKCVCPQCKKNNTIQKNKEKKEKLKEIEKQNREKQNKEIARNKEDFLKYLKNKEH